MILVDTNVLLDVVTNDLTWFEWSSLQLEVSALNQTVAINDVIYAELSVRFDSIERLESFLSGVGITMRTIPRPALFLAGKVFERYRLAGGLRYGVLPDFFIGAHAAVSELILLTRDAQRYRSYFPTVELVTP